MEKEKVTSQAVRETLRTMEDSGYREFHGSLLPGVDHILGVRIPLLRTYARKLARQDWQEWFEKADDVYYEETMLRGLVMAYAKMELSERMEKIRRFVPDIQNWAVCDSVCSTIKDAEKYQKEFWDFLDPYFGSDKEYEARFAAVMLLSHFVNREYLEPALLKLEEIHQEGYYAKMAAAWAISVYFAAFPKEVLVYLQGKNGLDSFTYQKALQKIVESNRVDREMKSVIREMRQRGKKDGNEHGSSH